MTREEIIRNLKYTMEKHKNDFVKTFETNISAMCKDILDYLEQEPCDDAISRQAVLDLMRGLTRWCVRSEDGKFNNVGLLYDDVMFGIDKLPSVTPQQRTGRWRKVSMDKYIQHATYYYECSECGDQHIGQVNYCPNCGARMEAGE